MIVAVNAAWTDFAKGHGGRRGPGRARQLSGGLRPSGRREHNRAGNRHGLREILAGTRGKLVLSYDCHSPQEQQWFVLTAARLKYPGPRRRRSTRECDRALAGAGGGSLACAAPRRRRRGRAVARPGGPDALMEPGSRGVVWVERRGNDRGVPWSTRSPRIPSRWQRCARRCAAPGAGRGRSAR